MTSPAGFRSSRLLSVIYLKRRRLRDQKARADLLKLTALGERLFYQHPVTPSRQSARPGPLCASIRYRRPLSRAVQVLHSYTLASKD